MAKDYKSSVRHFLEDGSRRRERPPTLTLDEINFLLNETNASLDVGAEDVMFKQCAKKLREMRAWAGSASIKDSNDPR